jgi:hypothetical protein
MHTLTLFSTTDLAGSLHILPVLFHRVNRFASADEQAVADLLRAGGVRERATVQIPGEPVALAEDLIPQIQACVRAGSAKVILDHATGWLFLDRLRNDKREILWVGLIQEAFLSQFRTNLPEAKTLSVALKTRAPDTLALALSAAIPSMSHGEAKIALTRSGVVMTFPMLLTLIREALRHAAERHEAINTSASPGPAPLSAEDILNGVVVEPLHAHDTAD